MIWIDALISLFFGFIIDFCMCGFFVLCFLHKIWYNSWIPKKRNLPFSTKLKENFEKGMIKK